MRTTIIGGQGFIGSHLAKKLREEGQELYLPKRGEDGIFRKKLGKVIYCAGVTSDFRQRPIDTIRAHVSLLTEMMERSDFETFVYLSSTRVYSNENDDTKCTVGQTLRVNSNHPEDLFNLSKLTGEAICLHSGRIGVNVARVSNVCGDDFDSNNFIYSIIKDAVDKKKIVLRSALESSKDYIDIDDVVRLLINISSTGTGGIYNVASGSNISSGDWIRQIQKLTECSVHVLPGAPTITFPELDVSRLRNELNFEPRNCLLMAPTLVDYYLRRKES